MSFTTHWRSSAGRLRARYRRALARKPRVVEELVDYYWHRPLAAWLTVALESTSVTPNQVTLASLVAGWAAAILVLAAAWRSESWWLPAGGAMLLVSVVFDCADGQLARLRGEHSEFGRVVDGVTDYLVSFGFYVALTAMIYVRVGAPWAALTALAGLTMPLRLLAYDRVRILYLAAHGGGGGAAEGLDSCSVVRTRRIAARGCFVETVLFGLYLGYQRLQVWLLPDPIAGRLPAAHQGSIGACDMRRASYLGLGTHLSLLYAASWLAGFSVEWLAWSQLLIALGLNALLMDVLRRHRHGAC